MRLEQLVRRLETKMADLGRFLALQPEPRDALRSEWSRLGERRRQRAAALAEAEARRDELRRRLADSRVTADRLPGQIEACFQCGAADQAYRLALELDHLRQALAADEADLPRLDQVCWSLRYDLRHLERRQARLESQLAGR